MRCRCLLLPLCLAAWLTAGPAAATLPKHAQLARMSLEELMHVDVTSVAGIAQPQLEAPAPITVLTPEDLRRNGIRSLVEALRLVPGMFVGHVNAGSWVAGTRGMSGSTLSAIRYLVLLDGRPVYDPVTSATFWNTLSLPIDDIDRIEVIRGPGATLWGVNAMNGVINIISKPAERTHGTLLSLASGELDPVDLSLRQGGATAGGTDWRVWTRYAEHDAFDTADGDPAGDAWSEWHAGLRLDRPIDPSRRWLLTAEAYTLPRSMAHVQRPVPGAHQQFVLADDNDRADGGHLLWRWQYDAGPGDGGSLQAYVDRTRLATARGGFSRQSADLDLRRWRGWGEAQQLIWGLQLTTTRDAIEEGPVLQFSPVDDHWSMFNAFVQNTSTLVPGRWYGMLGSKLTWHQFVGWQLQPGARLWWTPGNRQTFWASVSSPVRVPSRLERDGLLVFAYADPGLLAGGEATGVFEPIGVAGNRGLAPERLVAWEIGHRIEHAGVWSLETTAFYHDYRRLIGAPPTLYGQFTDAGVGHSIGLVVAGTWQVTPRWRLAGSLSRLELGVAGAELPFEEGRSPRHQAQLHSYFDFDPHWQLDAALYDVGALEAVDIPRYQRLDIGLTWRPRDTLEFALWGQNLLDARHAEASAIEVPRGVFAQATVRFR